MDSTHSAPDTSSHADQSHHVVPFGVLLGVFIALLALTYVTVAVTKIDLGSLNLWIALGVATVKAALVVLYFMHLRYDNLFNSIIFLCALVFVFLFLGITIMDTIQYNPAIERLLESQ